MRWHERELGLLTCQRSNKERHVCWLPQRVCRQTIPTKDNITLLECPQNTPMQCKSNPQGLKAYPSHVKYRSTVLFYKCLVWEGQLKSLFNWSSTGLAFDMNHDFGIREFDSNWTTSCVLVRVGCWIFDGFGFLCPRNKGSGDQMNRRAPWIQSREGGLVIDAHTLETKANIIVFLCFIITDIPVFVEGTMVIYN